jgi:transcriptional regulator with GAF, ATPase, and Fis domain
VQIADVLADPGYSLREVQRLGQFRTHLGLPLLREGNPIGVLLVSRVTVRPFDDKQIELLTTFADQAVIAIENTRLLNELRQRTDDLTARTAELTESLEQQTATSEVLQVISNSPGDLKPVFDAILANAVRICEANFGILLLYEGDWFRVAAAHNREADGTSRRARRNRGRLHHGPEHRPDERRHSARDPAYRPGCAAWCPASRSRVMAGHACRGLFC